MFFKITFKTEAQRLTRWATNLRRNGMTFSFVIVNQEGIQNDNTRNIVIADYSDIIALHPARMNLKYAELEVVPTTPKQREALMWMIGSTKATPFWAPGALVDHIRKLVDKGVVCYQFNANPKDNGDEMFWVRGDGEPAMTYAHDVCACYPINSEAYEKRTGKAAPIMVVLKYNAALSNKVWKAGATTAVKALGFKDREVLWSWPTMMGADYFERTKHPKYEIK